MGAPAVLELGDSRVERKVAALALEVACLREERAKLAFTVGLRAALAQYIVFPQRQLRFLFFVGFLQAQQEHRE